MTLGEKIRALRNSRDVSLRRLSEITGVSKTTLSDLENNIKNPSLETVEKIAHAFGLKVSQLLNEVESSAELVESTKTDSSDLFDSFLKSESFIRTLYRAKDKPKEELDEMALFLEAYLRAKDMSGENKK